MTPVSITEHVGSYLGLRRALGHRLETPERLLAEFTSWLLSQPNPRLTTETVLRWASDATLTRDGQLSGARVAYRLSVVRSFASYLAAFDPTVEIPPHGLVRPGVERSVPYLFSPEEIRDLMQAAAALPSPTWSRTMTTLIGLMAATGLRTSEAFRLDDIDHDLEAGTLLVRHSKNGRSRLLPLHPSTSTALSSYQQDRRAARSPEAGAALLVSARGHRLGQRVPVGSTFRTLLQVAGISAPPGRRPPRLHNLRHTFAVNTLRDWHLDGQPVQPRLPALSDYLGHINPHHTYWYLQAVPELMRPLVDRYESYLASTAPGTSTRGRS